MVLIRTGGKVASLWSAFLGRLALRVMGIRAGVGGFHLHALQVVIWIEDASRSRS